MSKLIEEIKAMSPEERAELAEAIRSLDSEPVPVTEIAAGPVAVDEFGRRLSPSEEYDRLHPLQLLSPGYTETVTDYETGKRKIKKWTVDEIEQHNSKAREEHEAAKSQYLKERGVSA